MLLTTANMRKSQNLSLTVDIGSVKQKTSQVERLLGLQINENYKFREYLQDNDKSVLKSLNKRLNALKQIRRVTSFSQRLAIANGIFNSKLVFLISVWAGTEDYLLSSLRIVVNKAMRVVCNVGKSVKLEELYKQTNWLSVRQSAVYHSLMAARRILCTQQPRYLYNKLSEALRFERERQHDHDTRFGAVQAAPPPGPHLRLLAIQGRGALQAATRGHCGPTRGGQRGQTIQEDPEEMGHIKL